MEEVNREAKRIKVKADEPKGKKRVKNPRHQKSESVIPVSSFRNTVKMTPAKSRKGLTNKEFAKADPNFKKACESVAGDGSIRKGQNFPSKAGSRSCSGHEWPSKRQASKWRMKKGLAYKQGR